MNYDTYIDLFPSRYIMRVSAGQEGAEGLMPQGLFIIGASDNKLGNARGSTKVHCNALIRHGMTILHKGSTRINILLSKANAHWDLEISRGQQYVTSEPGTWFSMAPRGKRK